MWVIIATILGGILLDIQIAEAYKVEVQEVITVIERPEARIEVVYNWDRARIETEIRATFHEEPNTAVAVAIEEGGLWQERQSDHRKNGVREPSFCTFQIHEPSWMKEAKRLGYGDYKTNPASCIKMARHIYDTTGKNFNQWSAYKSGAYKKHL